MIKSPKLYFYDTGLLCWLLGIQEAAHLLSHLLRGSIFETFIVSELIKERLNRVDNSGLYLWRDSNGNEIELIIPV